MKKILWLVAVSVILLSNSAKAQSYCIPQYPNTFFEHIVNVNFGTINNSTFSQGYTDYSFLTNTVDPGSSVPIVVTGNAWNTFFYYVAVWIDWNDNGNFNDPGEYYLLGNNQSQAGNYPIPGTITVPNNAKAGTTRMRVVLMSGQAPTDPCVPMTIVGEIEDYGVIITEKGMNDIGIVSLDSLSENCPGNIDVYATMRNFGQNQVTSANVNWTVNGVTQTPFNFSGTLDTAGGAGSTDAHVNLGSLNLVQGNNYDIKAWSSNPNGVADTLNDNDTIVDQTAAAMSGSFTIGGVGADFPDLASAANALNTYGLCGPANFTINPGTYSGAVELSDIEGASQSHQIIIDGLDASSVKLTHDGTTQSSTILFSGADWVTLRNVTIEITKTQTGAQGIRLFNASDHNSVIDCIIKMPSVSGNWCVGIASSTLDDNPGAQGDNADYFTVEGCTISGGTEGLHLNGLFSDRGHQNIVRNNVIHSIRDFGITMDEMDSSVIQGNHISGIANVAGDGISFRGMQRFVLDGNYVQAPDYGMDINRPNMDSAGSAIISNNMIIADNDDGIRVYQGTNVQFYHNTIQGKRGMYFYGTQSQIDLRNNILYSPTGYAIEAALPDSFSHVDNNVYYTTSPSQFVLFGITYPDLAQWQAAQPAFNASSKQGDPGFFSSTYLKPTNSLANNIGAALGVTEDLEGNTRNASTPDAGAIEYEIYSNDVGVVSIDSPFAFCPGTENIVATISNFGNSVVDSLRVNWAINGVQQPTFFFLQPLDTFGGAGSQTAQMTLGSFNFLLGVNYNIDVWTSHPNGIADPNTANDSMSVLTKTSLIGTLTIGGPGADYANITDAVDDVLFAGICGPTVFQINPGTYLEPIQLTEINGASNVNTLTFDGLSSDSVTIVSDGSSQNSVVHLNGADWIRFKNITFENMAAIDTKWGIIFTNSANHNVIDSCRVILPVTSFSSSAAVVSSASITSASGSGDNANHNTIKNSYISGGYYAVRFYGGGTSNRNDGNKVLNNVIENGWYYGVYMWSQDSAKVNGNHISNLAHAAAYGISLRDLNGFEVNENYVHGNKYGIQFTDANFDFPIGTSQIINNMVVCPGGDGIYIADGTDIQIYHNSVLGEPGLYMQGTLTGISVVNNVLTSNFDYAFETTISSIHPMLDHNVYHVFSGWFFIKHGNQYTDLASWQAAFPQYNQKSQSGDPKFYSPTDLHLLGTIANDSATALGVQVDIDGDTRSTTTPDIGADEYTPASFDMAYAELIAPAQDETCPSGPTDVIVAAVNTGLSAADFALNSMLVEVYITGPNPDTISTTISDNSLNGGLPLGSGDTINITVGQVQVDAFGEYGFNTVISYAADQQPINDDGAESMFLGMITSFPWTEDFESFDVAQDGSGMKNGWFNAFPTVPTTSDYRWNAHSGNTPTSSTGPDATITMGKYVYSEASSQGAFAQLISPCLQLDSVQAAKLSFDYHMYGFSVNALEIDVYSSSVWHNNIFSLNGSQQANETDSFETETLNLSGYSGISRVRLTAKRGNGQLADMAVDNVSVFEPVATDIEVVGVEVAGPRSCLNGFQDVSVMVYNAGSQSIDFSANNTLITVDISGAGMGVLDTLLTTNAVNGGLPLAPGDTLDFIIGDWDFNQNGIYEFDLFAELNGDLNDLNDSIFGFEVLAEQLQNSFPSFEDFETFSNNPNGTGLQNGWTNFPNGNGADYLWIGNNGATVSGSSGPNVDHTLGTAAGTFMYTPSIGGSQGDIAVLNSPCFDVTNIANPSVVFYYHMYGSGMGTLFVDAFDGTNWILNLDSIWGQQQTGSNEPWLRRNTDLTSAKTSNTMRYRFRARRGANFRSDMAVDDAQFRQIPDNDLESNSVTIPNSGCNLSANDSIYVEVSNYGLLSANNFDIEYRVSATSPWTVGLTVTTPLASGATQAYKINGVDLSQAQLYCIEAKVVYTADADTTNNTSPASCIFGLQKPDITATQDDEVCDFGAMTLAVTHSGDSADWYSDPALTNFLFTGDSYQTPALSSTTTYYVRSRNNNGCSSIASPVVAEVSTIDHVDFTHNIVGGGTVDFTSSLSTNFDSIFWDFGDQATSNQLNPSHTYTQSGIYVVLHQGFNGSCEDDTSKAILVAVGLEENPWSAEINVFPNPNDGKFELDIPNANGTVLIEILDSKGVRVHQREIETDRGIHPEFNLKGLPSGNYLIKITNGEKVSIKRLTIN